jgi:transcriptional regulator with XRE-family HTH domain
MKNTETLMNSSIGERLKEFRNSKHLKQVPFCERIGISNGYLSEVENGKKTPGGEILVSLLREFPDIDIYWLLTGKETTKKDNAAEKNWHEEYLKLLGRYEEASAICDKLLKIIKEGEKNTLLHEKTGRNALAAGINASGVRH